MNKVSCRPFHFFYFTFLLTMLNLMLILSFIYSSPSFTFFYFTLLQDDHVLLLVKSKASGASTASPAAATPSTTATPAATNTSTPFSTTSTASSSVPAPSSTSAPSTTSSSSASNAGTASAASNPFMNMGMGGMGMGGMGMGGMGGMNNMNPEQFESMMNNPMMREMSERMMDQLASDPAMFDMLVSSNPQLRAILDSNPEVRRMMQDPEVLRRSMEMARNPALMREMMAQNDRAMANIQSMPGGYNAMAAMFNDVQNPIQEALEGALDNDETPRTNQDHGNEPAELNEDGVPASSPMPNPWATGTSSTSSAGATGGIGAGAGAGGDSFANMMRMMQGMNSASSTSASTSGAASGSTAGAAPGGAFNPYAGFGNMGGMGGMGGMQDEASMREMLNNPMMRSMMDSFITNPEMMRSMIGMNPETAHLLNDPMFNMMLSNPELMRASLNMLNARQNPAAAGAGTNGNTDINPFNFMSGSTPASGTTSATTGANPNSNAAAEAFMQMMMRNSGGAAGAGQGQGMGGMGGMGAAPISPRDADLAGTSRAARENAAVMYAEQIQTIMGMGFTDADAILSALIYTGGNVEAAIDRLL